VVIGLRGTARASGRHTHDKSGEAPFVTASSFPGSLLRERFLPLRNRWSMRPSLA